jgi:phage shock protein C
MEKKLTRIEGPGKEIGGVAAGLAQYLSVDVLIVRLLFIVGFFKPVPVFTIYILLWIFLPVSYTSRMADGLPFAKTEPISTLEQKERKSRVMGVGLVVLGAYFLLEEFLPQFNVWRYWPLTLIGLGAYMLLKNPSNKSDNNTSNF